MKDILSVKKDFPIFSNLPELVYLDSAATSLKPSCVIQKITEYYEHYSANIVRGAYTIAERATQEYEDSRTEVAQFIGARSSNEVVFTKNATESLNLAAFGLARTVLEKGDTIICSIEDHHSNFVPWQRIAKEHQCTLTLWNMNEEGVCSLDDLEKLITKKTKVVALPHVSNVLGHTYPVRDIVRMVKSIAPKAVVLVDGTQSVPHIPVDVQALECDLLAFSSHKMLGPTGVGVLWGKEELLNDIPPLLFGGHMIESVTATETTFKSAPHVFEAGTQHIAGVSALKEAVRYLRELGMEQIASHERTLARTCREALAAEFPRMSVLGPRDLSDQTGILSFAYPGLHPHDITYILGKQHICCRAGHHCAMPLHQTLNVSSSTRISFYMYNEPADIEAFVKGFTHVLHTLS